MAILRPQTIDKECWWYVSEQDWNEWLYRAHGGNETAKKRLGDYSFAARIMETEEGIHPAEACDRCAANGQANSCKIKPRGRGSCACCRVKGRKCSFATGMKKSKRHGRTLLSDLPQHLSHQPQASSGRGISSITALEQDLLEIRARMQGMEEEVKERNARLEEMTQSMKDETKEKNARLEEMMQNMNDTLTQIVRLVWWSIPALTALRQDCTSLWNTLMNQDLPEPQLPSSEDLEAGLQESLDNDNEPMSQAYVDRMRMCAVDESIEAQSRWQTGNDSK